MEVPPYGTGHPTSRPHTTGSARLPLPNPWR